uniref:Trafficking protein particle complex subunit n=1 Tax=Heterosigma akashiwo TaxID=2829 RepID=A0A6V1NSM5_HETAK|mmetsp:Transcript_3264/g.4746  ORF Transcript_3264/g.4746 Transcript_3264/m.4746 type:complete len:190 (+) Transcript_3264:241-810(+)
MSRIPNILDRPVPKINKEVSLSAFSFLFSEMVQYNQNRVMSISDLEKRLEEVGYRVGLRVLELLGHRERAQRRRVRLLPTLQFVSTNVWKYLFGKQADSLERSTENEDEYMIHEAEPLPNAFISVPPDLGHLNCAAFTAGVVAGALDGASFPARVTAHGVAVEGGPRREKTVFLVKFDREVVDREIKLG